MSNEWHSVCRTCTHGAGEVIPLNSVHNIYSSFGLELVELTTTIGEMLMECANVKFQTNDGLPQNMCIQCASTLRAAFTYKRMCEQSDAKLRQIYFEHVSSFQIKLESLPDIADPNDEIHEEHVFEDTFSKTLNDECSKDDGSEIDDEWQVDLVSELTASTGNGMKEGSVGEEAVNSQFDETTFICEICNVSFTTRRNILRHFHRPRHLKRYRQLHGCDVDTVNQERTSEKTDAPDDADKIVARARCVDGQWECEICNKSLAYRTTLKYHVRLHLGLQLKRCQFCDRTFSKEYALKVHIGRRHSKGFPCKSCDQVFDTNVALRSHAKAVHEPPPKHTCEICSKEFLRLVNLEQHMLTHATPKPEKKYICQTCSKVFGRANTLNRHQITHTGEKNFECHICQRKLSTKQTLRDHMRIHGERSRDEYQHLCPHCGRKFITLTHMAGHIRTKHTGETPYKCKDCGMAFHRSDLLAQHRLKHVPRFICKICDKSLSSKERLKCHARMHSGEKPHRFECSMCDKSFSQSKSLKTHLRGHSGDIPNKCNVCDDIFINPRLLEIHRRQFEH